VTLRRLVLWRHGETDYNAARRMQGHYDSLLTAVGLEQARRAAPVIAAFGPDLVLTSDLRRAADTAAVLASCTGLVPYVDKRLRETNLGQWQGLTHAEVDASWPGARLTWRHNPRWAPPDGESRVEVATRGAAVIAEVDAGASEVAVVCGHGGLIAGLTGHLLELPVQRWPVLGGVGNCRWTVLERFAADAGAGSSGADFEAGGGVGWRLVAYNAGLDG
jgi:glucosyl-3-phosphoglycerate phosphatase